MSRDLDHERLNRKLMGYEGFESSPYFNFRKNYKRSSPKQVDYIERLQKELMSAGIDCRRIVEDPYYNWRIYSMDAVTVIRELVKLRAEHDIHTGRVRVYYNLCKDQDGRRYHYATKRWHAVPKGFTLIGELRYETIDGSEFKKWPMEKKLVCVSV